MKRRVAVAGLSLAGFVCLVAFAAAQHPAPAVQQPRLSNFPDRPKAPPEVLARGKAAFSANCSFCHGSDAGGGATGPNLLRSGVVLEDKDGELIAPIVHGARQDKGMPRIPIDDQSIKDIAAWLHSLHVASRTDPNAEKINIVVGDAKTGQATFQRMCGSCHSVTGDLKGIATRYPDPKLMQQEWMMPGGGGGRGRADMIQQIPGVPPLTATVVMPDGRKVEGKVDRIDDFDIALTLPDGTLRSIALNNGEPKVELHDPLAAHRDLLRKYTDKEIHDITAYLVTIK